MYEKEQKRKADLAEKTKVQYKESLLRQIDDHEKSLEAVRAQLRRENELIRQQQLQHEQELDENDQVKAQFVQKEKVTRALDIKERIQRRERMKQESIERAQRKSRALQLELEHGR